jgi:phenylacetate-CoA ligase
VVGGRTVLPLDVWPAVEAVDDCAAGLFQVIRQSRETDVLRLRVGYAGSPNLATLQADVRASVAAAVGVEPDVELVPNESLLRLGPPHKIPRVAKS